VKAKKILVVDDEPVVRKLITFCLRRKGLEILEADSGTSAIEICKIHRGEIALALVDVIMPGIHGPQLVRYLNKLDPDIQILYMSGFPHIEAINRGMTDFISKPFTSARLIACIRRVMASKEELRRANSSESEQLPCEP
jgi:two-component system cell cycle sensor histidine kinase/response regulator CckA